MTRSLPLLAVAAAACSLLRAELPKTSDDLFRLDHIWTASISLGAAEWTALQPPDQGPGGHPFGG